MSEINVQYVEMLCYPTVYSRRLHQKRAHNSWNLFKQLLNVFEISQFKLLQMEMDPDPMSVDWK